MAVAGAGEERAAACGRPERARGRQDLRATWAAGLRASQGTSAAGKGQFPVRVSETIVLPAARARRGPLLWPGWLRRSSPRAPWNEGAADLLPFKCLFSLLGARAPLQIPASPRPPMPLCHVSEPPCPALSDGATCEVLVSVLPLGAHSAPGTCWAWGTRPGISRCRRPQETRLLVEKMT